MFTTIKKKFGTLIRKYFSNQKCSYGSTIECINCHILIFAVTFCVIFACITQVWATNYEKTMIEEYENKVNQQVMAFETTVVDSYVEQIIDLDYTQMTKTPLLEIQQQRLDCIASIESLGIQENEHVNEMYYQLTREYQECTHILDNELYLYPYSQEEFNLLAKVVMKEQGANTSDDEAQKLVACVVLNRLTNNGINGDLENPTLLDIIREPGQYGKYGANMTWDVDMSDVTDKVKENVRQVLEHEYTCPLNVLFQAPFTQGNGIYKQFYNNGYGNTTYFCYGNLAPSNPYYEQYMTEKT